MKKFKVIILILLVVIVFSGCPGLFGPGKNNILQWIPDKYKIGSSLSYRETIAYQDGSPNFTEVYSGTVVDIDERETKTTVTINIGEGNFFMIAEDTTGKIVESNDEYLDHDDFVHLKTPVEVGTMWQTPYWGEDSTAKIIEVNATHDCVAGTYDDVVVISLTPNDAGSVYSVVTAYSYWSPSAGHLGYLRTYPDDPVTWNWTSYRWELYLISE